jgi:ankyrin repeat protein
MLNSHPLGRCKRSARQSGDQMDTAHEKRVDALHLSVLRCDIHRIDELFPEGANLNCTDAGGMTAHHCGVYRGDIEAVKLYHIS